MLLQLLSQSDCVEVLESVDGFSEPLVILLLDEHLVQGLVDGLVVIGLHGAQVGLHQVEVAALGEEADGSGVVETRGKHHQKVVEHQWLVVEVELQRAIVELDVGHLCDDVLEEGLLPSLGGVGHHGEDRVVILLILVVEEHQLRPEVSLLCCSEDLSTWGGGDKVVIRVYSTQT